MRTVAITGLFLGLFAGTAAAFVVTVNLKLVRSPLGVVRIDSAVSPTCVCGDTEARIRFRVREEDRIDIAILDEEGETVRTLMEDERLPQGGLTVAWDGRDDAGRVVADGRYGVSVRFREQGRTIDIPDPIEVDTAPPRVRIAALRPNVFSPDGDGRRDEVAIDYVASEDSAPAVLIDGAVAHEAKFVEAGEGTVVWDGTVGDRSLPAGVYDLALEVRDGAGNPGDPTEVELVRIRYIDLSRHRFVVPRGGILRFRVRTDAATFAWRLRGRGGLARRESGVQERIVSVRLPARLRRGRYLLRVEANGQADVAIVRVVRGRA